jgi:hypothetical protein
MFHICSKRMFQMFRLFQKYVAATVFMFQALDGTAGVTRRTFVGRGASAIQSIAREADADAGGPTCTIWTGVQAVPGYAREAERKQAAPVCMGRVRHSSDVSTRN